MYFTIFITFILLYVKVSGLDQKKKDFLLWFTPVFLGLFLTFALQYNVGYDYPNYIKAATNDNIGKIKLAQFVDDAEYLFAAIIEWVQGIGIPEILFVIISLIQVVVFSIALYNLHKEGESVFDILFLYFTICVSFFNQFNGIRQYVSVNLIFLAFVMHIKNPKSAPPFMLILIAPFFHRSAWAVAALFALVWLLQDRFKYSKWLLVIGSVLCAACYFLDVNKIIAWAVKETGIYKEYAAHNYVSRMTPLEIATRLAKLVVVYYSCWRLRKTELTVKESKFMALSELTVMMMILSWTSSLLWRLYMYADLFLMFPVLIFFKRKATKREKILIYAYLAAMLLVKILLFPKGEYLYHGLYNH